MSEPVQGVFWEVGDCGELYPTIDDAILAYWESCEGHSEAMLTLTEYTLGAGLETVPTGQVKVVNVDDWIDDQASRGWTRRASLTVADALTVPEVRALVEDVRQQDAVQLGAGLCRATLAPFLAAMEGKR